MLRGIAAVFAGFVLYSLSAVLLVQISGRPPSDSGGASFAAFAILYGAAIAAIAGFVTARLAPNRPLKHAIVLALLILSASAASSFLFQGPETSRSSLIGTILVDAPAAVVGGFLRHRTSLGDGRSGRGDGRRTVRQIERSLALSCRNPRAFPRLHGKSDSAVCFNGLVRFRSSGEHCNWGGASED